MEKTAGEFFTEWCPELQQALSAPFHPSEESFLPRGAEKGEKSTARRAMGMAYLGAESIIQRLNTTVGAHGWTFAVEIIKTQPVAVLGSLTILGATHHDFGETSTEGEPLKASLTDALKRCARNFGIGLYIWHLPQEWGEHDGYKWTKPPQFSSAAREMAIRLSGYTGAVMAPQPLASFPKARDEQRSTGLRQPTAQVTEAVRGAERPAASLGVEGEGPCPHCHAPAGKPHTAKCQTLAQAA